MYFLFPMTVYNTLCMTLYEGILLSAWIWFQFSVVCCVLVTYAGCVCVCWCVDCIFTCVTLHWRSALGWSEFEWTALSCVASPWVLHPEAVTQVNFSAETIELTSEHGTAVWQSPSQCQAKLTHPDTDLALHHKPTLCFCPSAERTASWHYDMRLDPYFKTKRERELNLCLYFCTSRV